MSQVFRFVFEHCKNDITFRLVSRKNEKIRVVIGSLVSPVSSSENVKNPLFMSLVRGANMLAVAAFGLSEQTGFFLMKLAVVVVVVAAAFGFTGLLASKYTDPSPAGSRNVVESTRHFGLKTPSVDDFLMAGAVTAVVCGDDGDDGSSSWTAAGSTTTGDGTWHNE